MTHTENCSAGKKSQVVHGLYMSQVGGSMFMLELPKTNFQWAPLGTRGSSQLCLWGKTSSCKIGGKATGGFWNFPFNNYMDYICHWNTNTFLQSYIYLMLRNGVELISSEGRSPEFRGKKYEHIGSISALQGSSSAGIGLWAFQSILSAKLHSKSSHTAAT